MCTYNITFVCLCHNCQSFTVTPAKVPNLYGRPAHNPRGRLNRRQRKGGIMIVEVHLVLERLRRTTVPLGNSYLLGIGKAETNQRSRMTLLSVERSEY